MNINMTFSPKVVGLLLSCVAIYFAGYAYGQAPVPSQATFCPVQAPANTSPSD